MNASVRLLFVLLAGCGAAEPMAGPESREGALTTPEAAPERTERKAAVGDIVEIRLPALVGAGFSWQPGPLPAGIEPVDSRVESRGGAADGAVDIQIFRFRAVAPGRAAIRFDYRRPWLRDQPSVRSVTRIVQVGP